MAFFTSCYSALYWT